ncbi:hypothetical protein SAMN02745830_05748 [Streptomyces sp. Amel2xC10]|nr:hypothetical protein SAMN02745830_05748 [Streptomyces sp. Amel2xC10]
MNADDTRTVRAGRRGGRVRGGTVRHLVCDDPATLVLLAAQACLTPHRRLSRADRPDRPDLMVFDLDPPDTATPTTSPPYGRRPAGCARCWTGWVCPAHR